jgi:hypothetical protein
MPDYRTMFDSEFLYAFHLAGREITLKISKVKGGEIKGEGGRKAKKPIVYFEGKEKGMALNKTNGKTIAELYGTNTDKWIGQLITIYPTTTQFGGREVDCIRVRPQIPRGKANPSQLDESRQAPQPDAEPYDGPPESDPPEPGSDG